MPPATPTIERDLNADPSQAITISVVIPVKDDRDGLELCLRALAAQTRVPDEIIVVDNGSADDSAAVAERGGATVVSCAEPGIPAASSVGYDRASGDIILRLDADCIPSAAWAEAMASAFAEQPDVGAFTGGARFIDGPAPLRVILAFAYLSAYVAIASLALGHLPLFGSNLGMRRDAWLDVRERVHRHDPRLHDDLDLAFHLGTQHPIRLCRHASMGMSMRPFASERSPLRAVGSGIRTVVVHWPHDFPPWRWWRLAWRTRVSRRSRRSAPRLKE